MLPPSFTFELFGHIYTFNPFTYIDPYMPTVRSIIFWLLFIKFIFAKFKALPSVIAGVPTIGPSDLSPAAQVSLYNSKYGG